MIDPTLLEAFRNTRFIVDGPQGEITLRVGERNRQLDELLENFGETGCAFVTAWNPGAVKLSDAENNARQNALIAEVQARGLPFLLGRGVGRDSSWPAEASILIVGASRLEAMELGKRFGQIAIVYAKHGESADLALC